MLRLALTLEVRRCVCLGAFMGPPALTRSLDRASVIAGPWNY